MKKTLSIRIIKRLMIFTIFVSVFFSVVTLWSFRNIVIDQVITSMRENASITHEKALMKLDKIEMRVDLITHDYDEDNISFNPFDLLEENNFKDIYKKNNDGSFTSLSSSKKLYVNQDLFNNDLSMTFYDVEDETSLLFYREVNGDELIIESSSYIFFDFVEHDTLNFENFVVIRNSNGDFFSNGLKTNRLFYMDFNQTIEDMLNSQIDFVRKRTDEGHFYITNNELEPIKSNILTMSKEGLIFLSHLKFVRTMLLITLLIVIISIVFSYIFGKKIGKPIEKMAESLFNLNDDLEYQVDLDELSLLSKRDDEVGLLSLSLIAYIKQSEIYKSQLDSRIKELEENERTTGALIDVHPDIFFVYDKEGTFIDSYTNDEFNLLMPKEKFIGKNIIEVMPEDVSRNAIRCIEETLSQGGIHYFEYSLKIEEVNEYYETRMTKLGDDKVLAIVRDITKRKEEEELIHKLSHTDYLTEVYNRRYFESILFELEKNQIVPSAILIIDVNGLKITNEAFGYRTGDEVLKLVSSEIQSIIPIGSTVSRIGGDEFGVVIKRFTHEETEKLVDKMYQKVNDKKINGVNLSVSIGWEVWNNPSINIRETFISAENYMLHKKLTESHSMRHQIIRTIIRTLNEKNKREKIHSEKVSVIARLIATEMKLSSHVIKEIELIGLLHDIGKIAIREEILNKPGKLTVDEYNEIKKHPESGYQILKSVDEYSSIADDVLMHHEKYDGTGYPKGLSGNEISLNARIITIADTYEAMVSDRAYRKGVSHMEAIEEILRCKGSQFDPELVDIFVNISDLENKILKG